MYIHMLYKYVYVEMEDYVNNSHHILLVFILVIDYVLIDFMETKSKNLSKVDITCDKLSIKQ